MTHQSQKILDEMQVRKSSKEKRKFRAWLREELEKAGWQTVEERGFFAGHNVIAGDPDRAEVFFTAHYDTQAVLPIPNFITPRNILFYVLYQLVIVVPLFIVLAVVEGLLLSFAPKEVLWWLMPFSSMALCVFFIWWMFFGVANKHTANDNTSGVLTLVETALAMPAADRARVCIIFFDNEERGMLGSSLFAANHRAVKESGLVINFDCVSDGDFIQFFPTKGLKRDAAALLWLEENYKGRADKTVEVVRGFGFYPSDNASFKKAAGVCALKKSGIFGYYMDRIHTSKDVVLMEENILLLRDGNLRLAEKLAGTPM